MNSHHVQTDEHGLPIPKGFDDDSPGGRPASKGPRWWTTPRARQMLGAVVVLSIIGVLVWPQVKQFALPEIAQWLAGRAQQRYVAGDLQGALSDMDSAIQLSPDDASIYYLRGLLRLNDQDNEEFLEKSLEDFNRALELDPDEAAYYAGRGDVLQHLGRHKEAVADLKRYVKLSPAGEAEPLNSLAYIRARAGVELEEALADVEQAIARGGPKPWFLDTRGYIHYRLGDDAKALADMNAAIVKEGEPTGFHLFADQRHRSSRGFRQRRIEHRLAVYYHHRGLIHQRLGNSAEAQADLARAKTLGYNPAKGIW